MSKVEVTPQLISRVKRIIIETGGTVIPMSLIFEALGYVGASGVIWGILVGVVSTIAIEIGYEVEKLGSILILKKKNKGDKNGKV